MRAAKHVAGLLGLMFTSGQALAAYQMNLSPGVTSFSQGAYDIHTMVMWICVVIGAVVFGAALFVMIGSFDALWAVVHKDLGTNEWIANLGITLFALPLIVLGPSRRLSCQSRMFSRGEAGSQSKNQTFFSHPVR